MSKFKFSVGPWNVHTGADSYSLETRHAIDMETKFAELGSKELEAKADMNLLMESAS